MPSTLMRRMALPALILLVALAAACGSSDDTKETKQASPQATSQAAAATSAAPSAAGAATTAATPAQASRTFTDDNGKSLTIEKPPTRVVALSPSMVEILYAVDAPPIARPSSATYPEAAKALPAIGSSYQVSIEQVAAQTPDLILADQQIQSAQVIAELQKIAPVFAVRVLSFEDVGKSLRTVGRIVGKQAQGEKAAKEIEDKMAAAQAKTKQAGQAPSVFIMIGDANAFFAAKPNAFVGDVVAKLGAKNVVPAGPDTSPFPGFTSYSLEQLALLDPDVILVLTAGPPNVPRLSQQLATNPAWAGLRAVKSARVHEIDPVTFVQSAGPRVSKDIDEVAPYLYPGVFPAKN